jgi:methionyl-tRNA synthetase
MRAIDSLKILLSPFLPFSSARLHQYLGFSDELFGQQSTQTEKDDLGEHTVLRYHPPESAIHWQPSQLKPGQPLRPPQPLFKKLEEKIVAEERARLGQKPE